MIMRPIELGELIKVLERDLPLSRRKEPVHVQTPFGSAPVWGICAYRGFYDQIALVVDPTRWDSEHTMTWEKLHKLLGELAAGALTLMGWKGGSYTYGPHTMIWIVLGPGLTSDVCVGGFEDGRLLWCLADQ